MGLQIAQQLGQLGEEVGALLLYVEDSWVLGSALQDVQHAAQGQAALGGHHKAVPSHSIRITIRGHGHTHLRGAHGGPRRMDSWPLPRCHSAPPTSRWGGPHLR